MQLQIEDLNVEIVVSVDKNYIFAIRNQKDSLQNVETTFCFSKCCFSKQIIMGFLIINFPLLNYSYPSYELFQNRVE